MSYGTTESEGKRFLNFKIVNQETVDGKKVKVPPYFAVDKKGEDGKYHVLPEKPKFVAGNLTKIKLGSFKWEEEDINTVQLYLEDGEEIYNVDLRFNLVARNIFNALLNLESYEGLRFELYTNKKGYPAVSIKQNNTNVDWKYKLEELPAVEKAVVGKKTVIDSSALDDFFLEQLKTLAEKVNSQKENATPKGGGASPKEVAPAQVSDEDIF